jgi:hypothetical protein
MKVLRLSSAFRGFVVVVSVIVACAAQGRSQSTSSIQGTTIDSTGAVIPAVKVTVGCDCKECPNRPCNECCPSDFSATVTSDDQGKFQINNVPSGVYWIRGEAAGFGEAEVHGVKVTAGSASTVTLTFKRESAGAAEAEKTTAAESTAFGEKVSLQVKVIDRQTDKPLENAKVTLLWQCDCKKECPTKPCSECCPSEKTLFTTVTDASGIITFDGPPGTYRIDTAYRAFSKDSVVNLAAGEKEKIKVSLVINPKM